MSDPKYNAASIQVLNYPENIQRRPGMYVGGRGRSALHHLVIEVVDNGVDEALAGHCENIEIVLHADGSITVTDDGRGIPVGVHDETGKSTLELVFTELHGGGKFDDNGAYSTSGGLHGVGIKATNALASWLEVTVRRNGVRYRQRHENGLPVTPVQILHPKSSQVLGEVGKRGSKTAVRKNKDRSIGTGTAIAFTPNPQFLNATKFAFAILSRRLQVMSYLVPGLRCEIIDERGDKPRRQTHLHKGGIEEYVEYLNRNRKTITEPLVIEGQVDGTQVRVVLQYHQGDDEELISFVNTIPTPDGGRHVSGFKAALTKAINVFAEGRRGLLKRGDTIAGQDTTAGLTAVVDIRMHDPNFVSQTKTKLGSEAVQGQVHTIVYTHLTKLLSKHGVGKKIVQRCLAASRARRAAKKARKLTMRKSILEVDALPGKLADTAKGSPVKETTLFIVEGDSAGGSCKQARDRRYHAILPLRGKVLNTERARLMRALKSKEIEAIVAAIGAGVASDFDVAEMRYGRVAILVDADVDGDHIKALLYTLFWRHFRPLVDAGKLYMARAPLYLVSKGKKSVYVYSDRERDQTVKTLTGNGKPPRVQRYKGLGEMNPSQLRETVFSQGEEKPWLNKHLYRVMVEEVAEANAAFSLWMGGGARERREKLMALWTGEEDF